ncbi:MAG: hypothetical protein Q9170_007854, partial [Blastenia crenularia]
MSTTTQPARLLHVRLPEWREGDKDEPLQLPAHLGTKHGKWNITNLFKRKQDPEQERIRVEAMVTKTRVPGHTKLIVKAKIIENHQRYAWAGILIPSQATYRDFVAYALAELRRQNLHPSRIPLRLLVRGLVVNWHDKRSRGRRLPHTLDEDNFQGSLLVYDRGLEDDGMPAEVEIIVSTEGLPPATPALPAPPATANSRRSYEMKRPKLDLDEQEKVPDELTGGLDVHNGIAIPRNMSRPGQDGYRTPNVHDYERHKVGSMDGGKVEVHDEDPESSPSTPPPSAGIFNLHSVAHIANLSRIDVALEKLHWRERIRHYTWTFFTMTMATGGIANVLYTVPFRFRGLDTIGVVFFLFNMVLFVINVSMISLRFYTFPETFRASYMHPTERLFLPASVVSFGTVLINISQYGLTRAGPWLSRAVLVLFWMDAALAVLASSVEQMTPIWIFPAYPLLVIGPHAAILCKNLKPHQALDIIIGGFTIQGIGFLVAFMIYASFIYRLMTQKLPQAGSRPGMFVSVGPSGFTVAGVLGMADSLSRNVDKDFMGDGPMAAMIVKVMASWICLWIWGLAFWFFFVSVGAHWTCARSKGGMAFGMNWFSFIFPNTALVTATFAVGKAFRSRSIQIIGCVMTVLLVIAWFLVFGMMMRAIKKKQILWPQVGEDRDEGGFKAPAKSERRDSLLKKLSSSTSHRPNRRLHDEQAVVSTSFILLRAYFVMNLQTADKSARNPDQYLLAGRITSTVSWVKIRKATKTRPEAAQPCRSYPDAVLRESSSDAERNSVVARSRYSTQKETHTRLALAPSGPPEQGCAPLRGIAETCPSRAPPPPPVRTMTATEVNHTLGKATIRDIQVEDLDQTQWQEYEIPSELEVLQRNTPKEIRNIIHESLDEQRAMRLSRLHTPAIAEADTTTADRVQWDDGDSVVVESSAMASRRHPGSSLSSFRTESVDILRGSTTSVGSESRGSGSLNPTTSDTSHTSRSSEDSHSDVKLTSRRLQKSREKLSRAHGLFRRFRRPKDAILISEAEQEPETYECTSCFDDIPNKDAISVPCRHKYCAPCFSQLISTALQNENQFPPKCCLEEIPRGILRTHLEARELEAFDTKALEYSVAIGSRYYCARPECAKWIDTTKARSQNGTLECPHCRHYLCTFCRGPVHAADQDCPQDFGLDATLQQAELAGWQRCYNCRAMVELNTGCRHITCKCRAEFCYTCGARWRTCACTEEDQARRAHRIRENLAKAEAEARAEEEEIRAAIAAVEEAERQAEVERREEEERQEEAREEEARQITLREARRVGNINRHFDGLRVIFEQVREQQDGALAARHEMQMQEIEAEEASLEVEATKRNDPEKERARIITSTATEIHELRRKQANELVQTRLRHRQDEDELLSKLVETENDTSGHEILLAAQDLERSSLRSIQTREIDKLKRREGMYLRFLDERVAREVEQLKLA